MFRSRPACLLGVIAALSLAGCAVPNPKVRLDTVGPAPGNYRGGPDGWLQVYTRTDPVFSNGSWHYPHTPYSVYSPAGDKVRSVVNRAGDTDPVPMVVSLPPGPYVVYAQAEGYGRVAVPVVIHRGRITPVHLERTGLPTPASSTETNLVRLPKGPTVGFRAP